MIAPSRPAASSVRASAAARRRGFLVALVPLAVVLLFGGCDEQLATTATCPELCPEQQVTVQQLELQPVAFDTTVTGFPLRGLEPQLLVAGGGTLDVRAIYRFDDVPTHYTKSNGDSVAITQILDPILRLLIDRENSSVPADGASLAAYDVNAAGADTAVAELAPLFTPARRLGSLGVGPRPPGDTTRVDTLKIPLDAAALLATVGSGSRLRVGVRAEGTSGARINLAHGAQVEFRVAADTSIAPVKIFIASDTPEDDPLLRSDLASFPLIVSGTPAAAGPVLVVGGLPARRSMLRFAIPSSVLDSATIIRATLVLTQAPVGGFAAGDTAVIRPLPVTAAREVTDIARLFQLAANPGAGGNEIALVPPVRVAPGDSGRKEFNLANLMALWSSRGGTSLQPLLVLVVGSEGATPMEAAFYSAEAAPALRPTLRLSYVRRINFDLP